MTLYQYGLNPAPLKELIWAHYL